MKNLFLIATIVAALIAPPLYAGAMKMETDNGIRHISGGVGKDSRNKLAAMAEGFRLKLTFASETGAYRFNIPVAILTKDNEPVASTFSYGPIMYVDVPPGEYIVIADDPTSGQLQFIKVFEDKQTSAVFRGGSD